MKEKDQSQAKSRRVTMNLDLDFNKTWGELQLDLQVSVRSQ